MTLRPSAHAHSLQRRNSTDLRGRVPIWRKFMLMASFGLLALAAAPAGAAWETTQWKVLEEAQTDRKYDWDNLHFVWTNAEPEGERVAIARKHEALLHQASRWYERLGFPQPAQTVKDGKFTGYLQTDTRNIGSYVSSAGMFLTSNPGFMTQDEPMWDLMAYSAVHELFHSIQRSYPKYSAWPSMPGSPDCGGGQDLKNTSWIVEGQAAYVQIRWTELQQGIRYGHPLTGSPRAGWVRYFDQRLDWGSLPLAVRMSYEKDQMTPADPHQPDWELGANYSWYCSYGTWYFWYAAGELLAQTPDQRVSYLQYILQQPGPWQDTGVAMVDAGLKQAAAAQDALAAYRDGLYSIYPEFVAQYLNDPAFYEKVEEIELGTPGLYDTGSATTSGGDNGALEQLAARAWRVRVHLPENSDRRTLIRFTLDAQDGTDRDQLHLIVGNKLVRRPLSSDTSYTQEDWVRRSAPEQDTVEFLVRVANVARDAAATKPAAYHLRVEVEGYYGDIAADTTRPFDSKQDAAAVAAKLPPGFEIRGPDASWTCLGGSKARARFTVQTPDHLADSVETGFAEALDSSEGQFADVMKMVQQMQRHGVDIGEDPNAIQEQLKNAQKKAREITEQLRPELTRRAAEGAAIARGRQTSNLQATFASSDGDCQMAIHAQWPGREGGQAMIITEPLSGDDRADFGISVQHKELFQDLLDLAELSGQDLSAFQARAEAMKQPFVWQPRSCRELLDSCPAAQCTAGRLRLEEVTPTRLAGTFDFDVEQILRNPPQDYLSASCEERARRTPVARVSGHFSATSSIEDHRTMFDIFLPGRQGGNLPGIIMWDEEEGNK